FWAGFRLAPTAAGQRVGRWMFRHAPEAVTSPAQFERFGPTYDGIVLALVALLCGLHAAVLTAAFGASAIALRIVPGVLGVSLLLMGNVMPRLRPNWVAGLRSRRMLENPELWRSVHRVFGAAFVLAGGATILAAAIAPRYAILVCIVSVLGSLLAGFLASLRPTGSVPHAALVAVGLVGAGEGGLQAQASPGSKPPIEINAPATVVEAAFTFVRGALTLHGTLTLPRSMKGRVPVVLIVAGSGATDRNGNGPGVNSNTYARLAWGLGEHGIASLRYDKRGIGASAGRGGDPATLSIDMYVADVGAAATALASDARFSGLILLGHSEGAGLVLQAANRGAPAAGVIMIAAQGRRLAEVLHEQFARQADSATVVAIDSAFARFLRGDDSGEVPAIARPLLMPMARNFLRSWAAYDPPGEARRFSGRLLILQGTTDVQLTLQDAELLLAAQPGATLLRLEGVNHVLKSIETMDLQAQLKTYRDPALPLAAPVVPAIAGWIQKLSR
ncbi:MAG TPA: alpha/beta hydrolase, partial [Gemmatimonadales bacterium]|nr:alpha/beta hydrolase [Gemmatimonadales bacterium]